MTNEINIMHISDLHFGITKDAPNGYGRKEVLQSFLDNLGEIPDDFHPNVLIISGDIAYQGVNPEKVEEFNTFYSDLYKKLSEINGTELAVLLCPGNHDRNGAGCEEGLRINCDEDAYGRAQETILTGGFRENFSAYANAIKSLDGISPYTSNIDDEIELGTGELDPYLFGYRVIEVSNAEVVFVALNSAWLCNWTAPSDEPHLAVSNRLVQAIYTNINVKYENLPKVTLMHHPFKYLNELETAQEGIAYVAEDQIKDHSDLIFFGHTHIPEKERDHGFFHGGALHADDCRHYCAWIVKLVIAEGDQNYHYKYGRYSLQPDRLEGQAIWRFTQVTPKDEMLPTNCMREIRRLREKIAYEEKKERLDDILAILYLIEHKYSPAEAYNQIIKVFQEYAPEETSNYVNEPTEENLELLAEAIGKIEFIELCQYLNALFDILRELTHSEEFENTYRTVGKRLIKTIEYPNQGEGNHE